MKKEIKTSKNKTELKKKFYAKLAVSKKTGVETIKKMKEIILKGEITYKAMAAQDWKLRSGTVDIQKRTLTCQQNIVKWNTEVKLLRTRRYSILVKASGTSEPPKVKKVLRALQQVRTVTKHGKESTKNVHVNKTGEKVDTHSTITIKRGKYYKLNFKQVNSLMHEYQMKILHCSATVKAMPVVIARRQNSFRNHIDRQAACRALQFKANMVMKGRMGSYDGVKKNLSDLFKLLAEQKVKVSKNKEQVNGLEQAQKKADHLMNDLKYKEDSLDWNMYQIRLLNC